MKAKIYRNIDMVQIDIQAGVAEYQLPKNVDWAKEKIDKILLLAPSASIVSPIDGVTPVLTRQELRNVFVDLYAGDDSEIALSMAAENIMHTCNHPVEVNNTLQLHLSRITFMEAPQTDACILLYVFWGGKEDANYEPAKRSVTVELDLQANEQMSFREVINRYLHAEFDTVRSITVWNAELNPVYISMQDHQLTYVMRSIYGALCRPEMLGMNAENTQIHPFRLDNVDVDFDNSFVLEASGSEHKSKITFEF